MNVGDTNELKSAPSPSVEDPMTSESSRSAEMPEGSDVAATPSPPVAEPNVSSDRPASSEKPRSPGPLAARGLGTTKPSSPQPSSQTKATGETTHSALTASKPSNKKKNPLPRLPGDKPQKDDGSVVAPPTQPSKIVVPNLRDPMPEDIREEMEAALAGTDVETFMAGSAGIPENRDRLSDGERVEATILKIHEDQVFVSLGGPDEGSVPLAHFEEPPSAGAKVEVIVRGFHKDDGLYGCVLPGQAIEVSDLSDLEEGAVVEATITKTNSGGLECSVGGAEGFIPISQISEYRIEDASEFVGQKLTCLVTQCNPRRRKLVLSRRAVLEREKEERRKELLESLSVGDTREGIVRSIKPFGAFVDLDGCDGMIHISKLSWDRVTDPQEVLEIGQKVKVKIDKIDPQTGKISLSYRDLLENPWDTVEQNFPIGQIVHGTVSRIANFGAFVRLAAGIEGLIHVSELAHHRVSRVENVVKEGDEIDVKVQTIDRETQRIGLSLKAAQAATASESKQQLETGEKDEAPPRDPVIKPQHSGPLRGGTGDSSGGERFGLRW